MEQQTEIDFTGTQLRDIGIRQSEFHANQEYKNWSDCAYDFALHFCRYHKELLIEDIRAAGKGKIPDPPSARAFGSVALRLIKNGIVEKIGIVQTQSPKSHCAFAQKYESKIYYWK